MNVNKVDCCRCQCPVSAADTFRLTFRDHAGVDAFFGGLTCGTCAAAYVGSGKSLPELSKLDPDAKGWFTRHEYAARVLILIHHLGTLPDGRRFWQAPLWKFEYPHLHVN